MKSNLLIAGAALFAIVIVVIMYQSLVVIPRAEIEAKERAQEAAIQAEQRAQLQREIKYNQCMRDAYSVYSSNWESHCELLELEAGCSLPNWKAKEFDAGYKEDQDRCVTMYK